MIALFNLTMKQVSPAVLCYRLQEIAKLSNSHQFSEIRVTYIQATHDRLIPERCVESFKKVFSHINIVQIEGPHFILQTNPLACAEVIINEIG